MVQALLVRAESVDQELYNRHTWNKLSYGRNTLRKCKVQDLLRAIYTWISLEFGVTKNFYAYSIFSELNICKRIITVCGRYSANGYCSRMLCVRTSQFICYFSHDDVYNVHNTRVVDGKSTRYSSTCILKMLSVNVLECIVNDFLIGPYLLLTWLYGLYYHFFEEV